MRHRHLVCLNIRKLSSVVSTNSILGGWMGRCWIFQNHNCPSENQRTQNFWEVKILDQNNVESKKEQD